MVNWLTSLLWCLKPGVGTRGCKALRMPGAAGQSLHSTARGAAGPVRFNMALAMRQRCALLRQRGRSLRSSPVTAATAASKERVDAKVWLLRLVEAGLLTSHAWYPAPSDIMQ